jgi:hypothetical protein
MRKSPVVNRKSPTFNVTVSSQRLLDDFKLACRKRGMKYSTVVSAAMRYFIEHPTANGWTGKGVEAKKKKPISSQ